MNAGRSGRFIVVVLACASVARGDDSLGLKLFEDKIRPILVEHCYSCHSAESKSLKGGLRLDTRVTTLKGGDSGPALTPSKPDESLLFKAISYADDVSGMPPDRKLSPAVVADVRRWIELGAPDPREAATTAKGEKAWDDVLAERKTWWSLQPVKRPTVPPQHDARSSSHPIDRFINAKLREAGLQPAESADPATLFRRLHLVLTGLPPRVGDVAEFVSHFSPPPSLPLSPSGSEERERGRKGEWEQKYAATVDALLASPQFGERWARHWLDVVRFSETHGNEWNYEVHHAWRYRDYVIRALNDDVPYDRFVQEHIAGDLLPPRWSEREQFNESPLGTAFYRFGEVNHDDCIGLRQIGFDLVDNQLDTLTKAFQASTVACARCHDHKLDAVSTRDYYALLGVLRSSRQIAHTLDAPAVNREAMENLSALQSHIRREIADVWRRDLAAVVDKWLAAAVSEEDKKKAKPWDDLRFVYRRATTDESDGIDAATWSKLQEEFDGESKKRDEFNRTQFETFADFRRGDFQGWQVDGLGLRGGPIAAGTPTIAPTGDRVVRQILPSGVGTHALSSKLNGSLRSSPISRGGRNLSLLVYGEHGAAVRLVSNNCQLNYKNFKYLTSDRPQWITFAVPDDAAELRCYIELMTMSDNPKFPDQLGQLSGDKQNYRVPTEEATADPRSSFGILRAVWHEGSATPQEDLTPFAALFVGPSPRSRDELKQRYVAHFEQALDRWTAGEATDDDVRRLDELLRAEVLPNQPDASPRLAKLVAEYHTVEAKLSLPRVAPGLADFGPGFDQPVLVRGDYQKPGDVVPRGYVPVLSRVGGDFSREPGSGRLALAERIASGENPLTARVMVNRVWHHLFGYGLVRTVDDFGRLGDLPSHPELLDYLAAEFVADGWSVKRLIRQIVTSDTFRRSSRVTDEDADSAALAEEMDPDNRLLRRYPARRLEAEAIRDAMLAVSGRLDATSFGPSIQPYREKAYADRRLFPGPLDGRGRRSVYIKVNLMESPQFLGVFNFPGGKVTQGRRDRTMVPAQSLALLNDPLVTELADAWAAKLIAHKDDTIASRIEHLFQAGLGRTPTAAESNRWQAAIDELARLHGVAEKGVLKSREVWKDAAHAMFNVEEFVFIP